MGIGAGYSGHNRGESSSRRVKGLGIDPLKGVLGDKNPALSQMLAKLKAQNTIPPSKKKIIVSDDFLNAIKPKPIDPIATNKEGKVKLNKFDVLPDTLDKKTMPGSAVTTSTTGLCLEGEQTNPSIVGTKVYGSHGGKKGYHSFDEMDPPVAAERTGALGEGKRGADNSIIKAGVPFAYQVASRLVIEQDDLGRKILVEYDRDIQSTALGRTHTVTGERIRVVGVIDPNGDGTEFIHPFEVRWADKLEGEESGGWIIWLPSAYLLIVDGTPLNIASGLTSAGGEYSDGWYKIDVISSTKSGQLWLQVDTLLLSATFAASQKENEEGIVNVLICDTFVNGDTNERKVENSVVSALVMNKTGDDEDKMPIPDGRSLSRAHHSGESTQPTQYWSILGFGKFSVDETGMDEKGMFSPSTEMEITDEADEEIAFLVRTGNVDQKDRNQIGYKTIKVKERFSPFHLTKEEDDSGELQPVIKYCFFYFDGQEQDLGDYRDIPFTGTVYLQAIKNGEHWSFSVANNSYEPSDGEEALNFKIYDFQEGKVICDYRTTFLSITSSAPGEEASGTPKPFDIETRTVTVDGGTQDTKWIVRCHFTFDGVEQVLSDYRVSIVNGTIYLNATRAAPSEDDETVPEWKFAMSNGRVSPSDGGKAMNIPLYVFSDGEPCLDYRTTFLTLNSPADEKSEIEVITDISIYFAAGDLRLTFQKKKVQIVGTPEEMESKTVRTPLGSKTIKLLTDVVYNESGDYVFKAKSRNVMVFDADDTDAENDVFTTTPHSNE